MSQYVLNLKFYHLGVRVQLNNFELFERLRKDFSYFVKEEFSRADIRIDSNLEPIPKNKLPLGVADSQSLNSLTFDQGHIRYNDYYGKLLSIYDYNNEYGQLWSPDIEKLHEITYLLILSRVGKKLDMHGLHKVHAMAITSGNKSIITMMPMKGGKSTLLSEMLVDQSLSIVSDDCPLIDRSGKLHPFPLRLGTGALPAEIHLKDRDTNKYTLKRDFYGEKQLLCLEALAHKIGIVADKQILILAKRTLGLPPKLIKISKFSMVKPLLINMVIGVGLPMVMEYFWQKGLTDFITKSQIAISRLLSAVMLLLRSECYEFQMSQDPSENARYLMNYLKRNS